MAAGKAPALADLLARSWVFGSDAAVFARQVRLLPDGRISGYYHAHEHGWAWRGGTLVFLDITGRVSTAFDRIEIDADGRLTLAGAVTHDPVVTHRLTETERFQSLAPDSRRFPIDVRAPDTVPGERRRHLVVLFANERSLHHQWPRDIPDGERSWDLLVSFYGERAGYDDLGACEFSSLQTRVRKCPAAHAAFGAGSPLWAYDRVWFADDDLHLSWSAINALFAISDNLGLAISQPALRDGSEVNHAITRRQPERLLRYTSFIEGMAPCFSRDALALCMPAYDRQVLGWGVDHIWPRLIGPPQNRLAIIDAVHMLHTRPFASGYARDEALAEEETLLAAYGVGRDIREFGHL